MKPKPDFTNQTQVSLLIEPTAIILDAAVQLYKINKLKSAMNKKGETQDYALEGAISYVLNKMKSVTGAE
jgi:hypothetical protein